MKIDLGISELCVLRISVRVFISSKVKATDAKNVLREEWISLLSVV